MAQFKKTELLVEGMDCNNCALGIKKQLDQLGFSNVFVNYATGEVVFESDTALGSDKAISKIKSMGYKVVANLSEGQSAVVNTGKTLKWKFYISLILTAPLLGEMIIPIALLHEPVFQLALALPVFAIGLWHFGRSAFFSIRSGIPNMDVLIVLGTSAAFIYSIIGTVLKLGHDYLFYETSASIVTLILFGNLLEHKAVKRTTTAIDDLVRLQKTMAKRIVTDQISGIERTESIDASAIRKNDLLMVNSGDKIPVDGIINWGEGSVDESVISGESQAIEKTSGDTVVGGTILIAGSMKINATAIGSGSVLGQIIEMVKNAQQDKPKLQTLADKISAVFVPAVAAISIITFALNYWAAGFGFQDALMRGIAVLVIACPCALGLAIPTAVIVGVGRVAKQGILIKGASTIQRLVGVRKIVFDKTGTLTNGRFVINSFNVIGETETIVKSIIAGMEKHSSHPIAQALTKEFADISPIEFNNIREEKGLGLFAEDEKGNTFILGSWRTLSGNIKPDDIHNLYLQKNDTLIASLEIEEEVRQDAASVISYLKLHGIVPVMLSGDRKDKCNNLAKVLGIEEVYAEQLPHQKLEIINRLEKEGGVAMVGDGINDAPALARATVGISLSDATGVAIQSAQIVLLKGNLSLLPKAWAISRNTLQIIKQNLFWAFFYNVIAIPIAAFGFLNPMVAAAAMAFSDVVVVVNSLRLKSKKLR